MNRRTGWIMSVNASSALITFRNLVEDFIQSVSENNQKVKMEIVTKGSNSIVPMIITFCIILYNP